VAKAARAKISRRPLGYEGNSSHYPNQRQPIKPKKTHQIATSAIALIRHALSLVFGHYPDTARRALASLLLVCIQDCRIAATTVLQ